LNSPRQQRQSPRLDARIEVGFQTEDEFALCYSKNISRGGIFLETEILPDPNARIEIVFDLSKILDESENQRIAILGKVVRLMSLSADGKNIHQIALQFIELDPQKELLLDRIFEKLQSKF
jgi:hypothetical protein